MGKCNGAEVFQLVGHYLLGKVASLIGTKNVGVYRDDGLAAIHQANGPIMYRIWKDNIALFKSEEPSISIDKKLDSNRLSRCLIQPRNEQVFSLEEAKQHPSTCILSQTIHLPSSNNCHR